MKDKSKERGRPPKPPQERRSVMLRIRLTIAERDSLDVAASGGKTSEWARAVLLKAAAEKSTDKK